MRAAGHLERRAGTARYLGTGGWNDLLADRGAAADDLVVDHGLVRQEGRRIGPQSRVHRRRREDRVRHHRADVAGVLDRVVREEIDLRRARVERTERRSTGSGGR